MTTTDAAPQGPAASPVQTSVRSAVPSPAPRCEPCEADPVGGLFASRSVAEHLVRGVLGLVLAVTALALAGRHPAALLLLVPAALSWRGCPTCWLLGLGETRRRRAGAAGPR